MLKNIRQTDIELLENIRENGCLFLCFAEVSPLVFVEKNGRKTLNKIWKEAVKKGYISEDGFILKHDELANEFLATNFRNKKFNLKIEINSLI